jgi:asparagine synthetase B (glutamine-hydrolysing)
LSAKFGTEQYEMVLKAGDMERCMPSLAWHLEEPRVGQSYPNFYAAKLASRFVKVVLSGSGGDELFGGYPWRYYRGNQGVQNFEEYINNHYDTIKKGKSKSIDCNGNFNGKYNYGYLIKINSNIHYFCNDIIKSK